VVGNHCFGGDPIIYIDRYVNNEKMAQEIVWEFVRSVLELFGISRGSVRAVVFFGFYAVTAFALYFHDDGRVRKIYLGFLFVAIITPMLVVMNVWPFYKWSPLHSAGVNNATDYDIYLLDQNGKELQYDRRASPPLTRSPLKGYAQKMANEYNVSENKEFSKFLLKNACLYRKKVENGSSLLPSLDFPKGLVSSLARSSFTVILPCFTVTPPCVYFPTYDGRNKHIYSK
jgi:hypothetical protein